MSDPNEQAEAVGVVSDRLDNLIHAAALPMPPKFHLDQILPALAELRDELRAIHVAMTGENPWED